jgi:hypothetical protein
MIVPSRPIGAVYKSTSARESFIFYLGFGSNCCTQAKRKKQIESK